MKTTIFRTVAAFALSAFAAAAMAQAYKWKDSRGRTQYGDIPPVGVKAVPLRANFPPASVPAPAAGAKPAADAKPAAKGPLTPAEQDAAFRKRRLEEQKKQEKEAQLAKDEAAKKENCARAQQMQRTIESGQRISRTDAKGERYFLDDAQRAQEAVKAREAVQSWCK